MNRSLSVLLPLLLCVPAAFADDDVPEDDVPLPTGKLSVVVDPGGHLTPVRRVFYLPDGKRLVSVGEDHTVRLWDAESLEVTWTFHLPGVGLQPGKWNVHEWDEAALSPDGKRLAVGGRYAHKDRVEHVAFLLSLSDGKLERVLRGHPTGVTTLAFSADGKRLASASWFPPEEKKKKDRDAIRIWDLTKDAKPLILRREGDRPVRTQSVAFSPDGKRLAWVSRMFAPMDFSPNGGLLDLQDGGKTLAKLTGSYVAYGRDGKTLFAADNRLRLYAADSGKELLDVDLPGKLARSLTVGPDSKSVLINGGHLYDVAAKKWTDLGASRKTNTPSYQGDFSPDGKRVVAVGADDANNWLVSQETTGRIVQQAEWGTPFVKNKGVGANWSADGKALCWMSEGEGKRKKVKGTFGDFRLDELRLEVKGKDVSQKKSNLQARGTLTFKAMGFSQKSGLRTFEVREDGKPIATFAGHNPTFVSKDRVAVLSTFQRRGISLYDARTGKRVGHVDTPQVILETLASSPDGRFLLTAYRDHVLTVWTVDPLAPLLSFYRNGNDWIVWTKEGYYAATPGGERLMNWKVDNGIDTMPTLYPADRFRKTLYRPDVIRKAFELGSVAEALKAIDGKDAKVTEVEKSLPPRATLRVVEQDKGKVTVEILAEAQAKSQPITSLRLMINGRPFTEEAKAAADYQAKPLDRAKTTWTVTIPEGTHTLDVLARGMDFSSRSDAVVVRHGKEGKRPTLHVLAVGIDDYSGGIAKLRCAANDAKDLAKAFSAVKKGGLFTECNVELLTDKQATTKAVADKLEALRKTAKREDVVVVFFAGHGMRQDRDLYLLTHEAKLKGKELDAKTALSGKELANHLGKVKGNVLLLLDACHSGAMANSFRGGSDDVARSLGGDDDTGVFVLAAAMGHQAALEKDGNGYFTAAVKEAIEGKDAVPRNHRDGRLYVQHLYAHVVDRVSERSNQEQIPFLLPPPRAAPFALRQFDLPKK